MAEVYISHHDIRTRFNPMFHGLKIIKLEEEIEEMYHLGTTITHYNYQVGFMSTRSTSPEEVAISIIEKREHLDRLKEKYNRYEKIHEQALQEVRRYEEWIHYFQSGFYTLEEVGQVFGVTRERIRQVFTSYRKAVSKRLIPNDEIDDEPISEEEIERLSTIIDENVMYQPKPRDIKLDPLHGIAAWLDEDFRKSAERKRKAEMTAL